MAQVYFDDVKEGQDIPTLEKTPTNRTLVQWAGASGDFFELHYDKEFAKTMGYPNVLVHGRLEAAYLTQLLTDWAGEKGVVKKMSVQYRGNAFPGQKLLIKGKVTKKYQKDNENIVELEIFVENPEGQKITPGSAIVALPKK
ncbi:MAG TPA: MaoC/PaaZ C-terminal domain-containing protein [Dehalococcoidia bacterium]|jgi:acyl dehydratase|nr:MaoC/PaaZ C-terminal domain-containing protein [Dehalococcoidia bacterium]